MNKFSLSFLDRQIDQLKINSFLTLFTEFGEVLVQYCPCTEKFSLKNGCQNWTYTFCVSDADLPSGVEICSITSDTIVEPYLLAIPACVFEDSVTISITGAGTESNPKQFNVNVSGNAGNDINIVSDGLYANAEGGGQDGQNGQDGKNGQNGQDGQNGQNGSNGAGPPVGMIFPVPSLTAPLNTQPLWGQLLNRLTFPELWTFAQGSGNIIDDVTWVGDALNVGKFSDGDGVNTFRLPNLRGYFLRPWNNDNGAQYPDDNRGHASVQGDAIRNIVGSSNVINTGGNVGTGALGPGPLMNRFGGNNSNLGNYENLDFDASNVVPTADENRPKNIAYMYVIQSASIV